MNFNSITRFSILSVMIAGLSNQNLMASAFGSDGAEDPYAAARAAAAAASTPSGSAAAAAAAASAPSGHVSGADQSGSTAAYSSLSTDQNAPVRSPYVPGLGGAYGEKNSVQAYPGHSIAPQVEGDNAFTAYYVDGYGPR